MVAKCRLLGGTFSSFTSHLFGISCVISFRFLKFYLLWNSSDTGPQRNWYVWFWTLWNSKISILFPTMHRYLGSIFQIFAWNLTGSMKKIISLWKRSFHSPQQRLPGRPAGNRCFRPLDGQTAKSAVTKEKQEMCRPPRVKHEKRRTAGCWISCSSWFKLKRKMRRTGGTSKKRSTTRKVLQETSFRWKSIPLSLNKFVECITCQNKQYVCNKWHKWHTKKVNAQHFNDLFLYFNIHFDLLPSSTVTLIS